MVEENTLIKVTDLVKTYKSGEGFINALDHVSFELKKGDFVCLAGPSGSGKTTLLNMLGTLDTPTSGEVRIDNMEVQALSQKRRSLYRRQYLGFVFQGYNLIPVLSAFENVALPLQMLGIDKDEIKTRVEEILDEMEILHKKDRVPSRLSGGEQQRVAVARALVKRPLIAFADEPTANLDSRTGEAILSLMKKMNKDHKTTFIYSTHDPSIIADAHRTLYIKDGALLRDEVKPE